MISLKHPSATASVADLIPRPLADSHWSVCGDHVEIFLSRYKDSALIRFLAPRMSRLRRYERYPLDSRGSRVWCLLDGRRTVRDVVEAYERRYPHDAFQAPQRVWSYLQILESSGFIEVVGASDNTDTRK